MCLVNSVARVELESPKAKVREGNAKAESRINRSLALEGWQFIVHFRTARKRALLAKAIAMKY